MLAEFSQLKAEPLSDYYKRATELLFLFNISDRENGVSQVTLSEAEEFILESLIEAFVAGLEDEELRLNSVSRGATTSKSLSETYAIVSESNRALGEIQKQFALYTTRQKAEAFDEISRAPLLANSVVARFSDRPPNSQGLANRFPQPANQSYQQQQYGRSHQEPYRPQQA